jgi:hypothetical protein
LAARAKLGSAASILISFVLFGHFYLEFLAEGSNVPIVAFIKFIAGMKVDQSVRRNASDRAASYRSGSRQVLDPIRAAEDILAVSVELERMDVHPAALVVAEREIAVAGVIPRNVGEASVFKELAKLSNIGMPERDIQIIVTPGLAPKQRVDALAAVRPDADSMRGEQRAQFNDILCAHSARTGFHDSSPKQVATACGHHRGAQTLERRKRGKG